MTYPFIKMHGLGNDFVIVDQRVHPQSFSEQTIQRISDRRLGVGCDQFILLSSPRSAQADIQMRIFNANGQEVNACGNASRCVGYLLSLEKSQPTHTIETKAGLLKVTSLGQGQITVDLGIPHLNWQSIPLQKEEDTLHLPLSFEGLKDPVAVSVGNPHLIFFVYDVESIDLEKVGHHFTRHPLFPEGTNVEIIERVEDQILKMRVYERGVGITPSCGTGACASVVAAFHRGLILTSTQIKVLLEGGSLIVDYQESVKMTGQVTLSFQGTLSSDLF